MKIILLAIATSFLLTSIAFTGIEEKNNPLPVVGNGPITLKTSNGCWDVNHFIANKGDTALSIPASIWYYDYGVSGELEIFSSELLDFVFPELRFQDPIDGASSRPFVAVTNDFVYLYSTMPGASSPEINRLDSIPTPTNYVAGFILDIYEFLLVNQIDSVNYAYSFYRNFSLAIDTQIILDIKPEAIISGYTFPPTEYYYFICGNQNGNSVFFAISQNDHQVTQQRALPNTAHNAKQILKDNDIFKILSSPGDTATYLNIFQTSGSNVSSYVVLSQSGISVSSIYRFSDFIIQPLIDPSGNGLERQLLLAGSQSDTILINKRVISLHFKPDEFGSGEYVSFGERGADSTDKAFFLTQYLTRLDSIQTGANPIWFADDFRCYVGIEEIEKNLAIHVYPNPADGQVNIQITGLAKGKDYFFEIYDEAGKLLWNQTILSKQEYQIPLQNFPKGMLLLRVNAGSKVVTKRIIKI